MSIDIQKQHNISEMSTLIRQLYERFNINYGNIISMDKVDEAINNIVLVNGDTSKLPQKVQESFRYGAKGTFGDKKIYIKSGVSIDTLFHEILHYITAEHMGLKHPILNNYSDQELAEQLNKYGENRFIRQIEQLDESMTRFITELAIPEITIKDAYKYGADVIRSYYDSVASKGGNPHFILSMYLNGSVEDARKFKESFNGEFSFVIDTIEQWHNIMFYVSKPEEPKMTKEEVSLAIETATNKIKGRGSK